MRRITFVAIVLALAALAMRSPQPTDAFARSEVARVRAHFDSAEREVRAHSVSGLSAAQRAARARALDRVHEYAQRSVFPHIDVEDYVQVDRQPPTRAGSRTLIRTRRMDHPARSRARNADCRLW